MALRTWALVGFAALVGFVAGPLLWAALSGLIAGILDAQGIVIPAATYLQFAPVAAFLGALGGAWVVLR